MAPDGVRCTSWPFEWAGVDFAPACLMLLAQLTLDVMSLSPCPNLSVVHSAHNCTEAIVCTCETSPYVVPVRKQVLSVDSGEFWRSMPTTPPPAELPTTGTARLYLSQRRALIPNQTAGRAILFVSLAPKSSLGPLCADVAFFYPCRALFFFLPSFPAGIKIRPPLLTFHFPPLLR